jgi:hypothetical protein
MAMPLMQEWIAAANVEPDELEELDVLNPILGGARRQS